MIFKKNKGELHNKKNIMLYKEKDKIICKIKEMILKLETIISNKKI